MVVRAGAVQGSTLSGYRSQFVRQHTGCCRTGEVRDYVGCHYLCQGGSVGLITPVMVFACLSVNSVTWNVIVWFSLNRAGLWATVSGRIDEILGLILFIMAEWQPIWVSNFSLLYIYTVCFSSTFARWRFRCCAWRRYAIYWMHLVLTELAACSRSVGTRLTISYY